MIYKEFKGKKLSSLGLGCMRLPTIGEDKCIDEKATAEMVEYAMKNGINYYDTAWGYHGGESELTMGRVLKKYPRESFYLASKFPGFSLENVQNVKGIFEKQLEKCQVEYFDFYLFHCVCDNNLEWYLDPKFGIMDYLLEQKKNGRIKHLGFSAHIDMPGFKRFVDAYCEHIEFVQLQINWLDWTYQNAKEKVEYLAERNIPVWVMEPVRGGRLAKLNPAYESELKQLMPDYSVCEWAFRFLQGIPEIVVTLSGMSNFEQLKENVQIYQTEQKLSKNNLEVLARIANEMTNNKTLMCTACRYCVEKCPQQLDIPQIIKLFNEHTFTGGRFNATVAVSALSENKRPADCIECRSCEAVCPQGIKISEAMKEFNKTLKG